MRAKFEDGKYEVIWDEPKRRFYALYYGEEWRDLVGDKLVFAMLQYVCSIQETVNQLIKQPIPMIICCLSCGQQHVDEGIWATKPHRTHLCKYCGLEWRPAPVYTVGVEHKPGQFEDDADPEARVQ